MFKKILPLFFIGLLWCTQPVYANIWSINNIFVDVQANNEVEAKQLAIQNAKEQAVQYLFHKLIYKPKGEEVRIPLWDKGQIDQYIETLSINTEQFGGGRYVASISINFIGARVIDYFKQHNITYALKEGDNILLVPIYSNEDAYLWGADDIEYNSVYQAFQQNLLQHELITFIVPDGTQIERLAFKAEDALNINPIALSQLAEAYNVKILFLVHIDAQQIQSAQFLDIDAKLIGSAWDTINYKWRNQLAIGADVEQVIDEVTVQLQKHLITDWKKVNAINPNQAEQKYAMKVVFNNLQQWQFIQNNLLDISGFSHVAIHDFSLDNAHIIIESPLNPEQLLNALSEHGFVVRHNDPYPILQLKTANKIQ